jgi:hypothetical protein
VTYRTGKEYWRKSWKFNTLKVLKFFSGDQLCQCSVEVISFTDIPSPSSGPMTRPIGREDFIIFTVKASNST